MHYHKVGKQGFKDNYFIQAEARVENPEVSKNEMQFIKCGNLKNITE